MILTLDVGNSNTTGGVFKDDKLIFQFRQTTNQNSSSDEIGIFVRSLFRENQIDPTQITEIGICSVVPPINYSLSNGILKYFGIEPLFIQAGIKTGLKLKTPNPKEIGADLIADSIGAIAACPNTDLIIVDLGTATTIHAVTKEHEYLGGSILTGLKIGVQALAQATSKLPHVDIKKADKACATCTIEAIQSGIYFGTAGAIKEICKTINAEVFKNSNAKIIGTGGFAKIFDSYGIFDKTIPELTLLGVKKALELNRQ
ncbi:type III pantothenate kinase [Treponema pectinovorum]|uniref:type III pantothenate kinase n=1 Tax=Treponema pectinovorum TaxID=164 RepID=UPI0011CADE2E|nr:type III pantothenate kinase [Treponema pectinovorum]